MWTSVSPWLKVEPAADGSGGFTTVMEAKVGRCRLTLSSPR